jgi:hypothetical protein
MFTLGNKEAIVNSTTQFPFIPATANVDLLNIKGFGTFSKAKLVSAVGRRASDAQLDKLSFTCPAASALGIAATEVGVAVVVHLRVNSLRQASESAIDFIKRGRPMILEIKVNGGDAAATVAATTLAAFNEYALKFANITLPVTAAINGDAIELTSTAGYFQINESVTFLKRGDIFAYTCVTSKGFDTTLTINDPAIAPGDATLILSNITGLAVGDNIVFFADSPTISRKITEIVTSTKTITFTPALVLAAEAVDTHAVYKTAAGVEAINDGKYLEENVRMATQFTSDIYSINPGMVPIIGAKYTMISWTCDPTEDAVGAPSWASHRVTDIKAAEYERNTFTLYFNEDVSLGAQGQVKYLVDWLESSGPVTFANFKKANGASAVDTANFIA